MAVFEYLAIGQDGQKQTGVISSDSARSARKELRLRQLAPLQVSEARSGKTSTARSRKQDQRIAHSDIVLMTRQLAMLMTSGATVEEALGSVASETERPSARRALMNVRSSVTEGYSLAEALGQSPKAFPVFYRAVISSGQASGRLGEVLDRLAQHLEKSQKMRRKILSALIYPLVLTGVAAIVVALLMIFVVPAVVEQFDTLGQTLPLLTRLVIGISELMRSWGLIIFPAGFLAIWIGRRAVEIPGVRRRRDTLVLSLPIIGRLVRGVNAAVFARTFATLSASGATVTDALGAARSATSNAVFRDAAERVRRRVEEGQSLARSMREAGVYPPMLLHMAASGERGGDLAGMMSRSADYLEDEFDASTGLALGLLEPILIVLLAAVVALIVLSIMLPILQLNTFATAI